MGLPVVVVPSGGVAVTEASNGFGLPIDIAGNGIGLAVTMVNSGGLPVVSTPPLAPSGFVNLTGADGAYLKGADGAYLYGVGP